MAYECECGCGQPVSKPGNRFIQGHSFQGRKHTEESKRKVSESKKRTYHPYRGKHLSEEHRHKVSEALKGRVFSEEWRRKLSEAGKRRRCPEEVRRKISQAHKGMKATPETRRKMSEVRQGELNSNWRGGISFDLYSPEFNDALRLAIRERDGFMCQFCGVPENGRAHCCHHIDYEKTNNDLENFTTLCSSCHPMTNVDRGRWTALFQARGE